MANYCRAVTKSLRGTLTLLKRQRAGTRVHTADPKLKSIWPNLKRGKKFVGTLYVLSVVTPQIRSIEFFKASKQNQTERPFI